MKNFYLIFALLTCITIASTAQTKNKSPFNRHSAKIKTENTVSELKSTATDGNLCSSAVAVTANTNINFDGGYGNYDYSRRWYSYTATQDGKITIAASTSTTASFYIYNTCDDYASSINQYSGSTVQIESNIGTTYYIETENSEPFTWSLTESDIVTGDFCTHPSTAGKGSNNYNATDFIAQWYAYTPQQDTRISLTWENHINGGFGVYDQCNGSEIAYGNENCIFTAQKNVTYYINAAAGANANWTLAESTLQPGDNCSNAITATKSSSNQYTHTALDCQWFKYTATQDGIITLGDPDNSSIPFVYYSVYNFCGNEYPPYSGDYGVSFPAHNGQTYYFQLQYANQDLTWSLTERAFQQGENCSNPTPITNTGTIDYTGFSIGYDEFEWYSYTATQDGKIVISAGDASADIFAYPNCGSEDYLYGYSDLTIFVQQGQTGYFKIANLNYFEWTLTETDIEDGDLCSQPVTAVSGDNNVTSNNGQTQWFSYTAASTGPVKVEFDMDKSSLGGGDFDYIEFYLFSECVGDINFDDNATREAIIGYGETSTPMVFNAVSGQTYKLAVYAGLYNVTDINGSKLVLTLTEDATVNPGEHCSNPLIANVGANDVPVNEMTWYKYTAEASGKTTFTSGSSSYYYVNGIYDACGSDISLISDALASGEFGSNSELNFNAVSGTDYYILLSFDEGSEGWMITEGGTWKNGEYYGTALTAYIGDNNTDLSNGNQWFKYTPTQNGIMTVSACDNFDEVMVYSSTMQLIDDDYTKDGCATVGIDAQAGETYYICWEGYQGGASSITWTLNVDIPNALYETFEPKASLIYPNPVTNYLYFTNIVKEGILKLYSISGNLVMTKDISRLDKISLSNLPNGMYLYSIAMDGETISGKLVKK
ncbi:T9SS type A sorting domain-containing protein [Labilibacter sediminis]|nr:T9SS type A sorting domain-containing protein [Labilibacter sediminis]